jgi:ArsR family transcriptional regulator
MSIRSYIGARNKNGMQACKILSSPTRYAILTVLLKSRNTKKEICVNEIAEEVGLSQSATSHQLALLEARGVVAGMKMGQMTCYELVESDLTSHIEKIIRMF